MECEESGRSLHARCFRGESEGCKCFESSLCFFDASKLCNGFGMEEGLVSYIMIVNAECVEDGHLVHGS
jgi:hypothetical protein